LELRLSVDGNAGIGAYTSGDIISEEEWRKHLPDIAYQPGCRQPNPVDTTP
jgi:hypothetical protein